MTTTKVKKISFTCFLALLFTAKMSFATDCQTKINAENDQSVVDFFTQMQNESEGYITSLKYSEIKHLVIDANNVIEILYDVTFEDSLETLKYKVQVTADENCAFLTSAGPASPQDF